MDSRHIFPDEVSNPLSFGQDCVRVDASGWRQGGVGEMFLYSGKLDLGMEFSPSNCSWSHSSLYAMDTWERGM